MKRLSPVLIIVVLIAGGVILSQTSSQNPHGELKWDCQDCHTADSWSTLRDPMPFNHDATGFALTGDHATAACIGCHKDLSFRKVASACADCHTDQHQGQLGLACENCHTPRDWQSRKDMLDIHAQRGFALTGVHAVADCESCHSGHVRQEYVGTPMECRGCHLPDYEATLDPPHVAAGFSTECTQCHHPASGTWEQASYTHLTFALEGAHAALECRACHGSSYAGTPTTCYDCHSADFASTVEPDHEQSGFGHNCLICHSVQSWVPATYNHNATAFPLTGRHTTVACIDCHTTGYAGTPTDCYSCHQTAFQGTTDPNHVLANFDHNCLQCHATSGWTPATFDHAGTAFPLTGAHTTLQCISCHASGYTGTSSTCFACHQSGYDGTTNPSHVAAGFPTDCQNCHSTTGWTPANWDHDAQYFPIYSGAHAGQWSSCATCHTNPTDFGTFDCTGCHEHAQSTMDAKHSEVQNYQYLSSACYTCHPRGRH